MFPHSLLLRESAILFFLNSYHAGINLKVRCNHRSTNQSRLALGARTNRCIDPWVQQSNWRHPQPIRNWSWKEILPMINREINILGKRWEESTNRECHDKKVPSNYLKQIDFASKLFSILQFYSRDAQSKTRNKCWFFLSDFSTAQGKSRWLLTNQNGSHAPWIRLYQFLNKNWIYYFRFRNGLWTQ